MSTSPNPFEAPKASLDVPDPGPSGLGGWLALLGVVLAASLLKLVLHILGTYPPIFRSGTWEKLTTPGGPAYHPLWGPVLGGEIAANCVFSVILVTLLVLFFRKSRRFPALFIAFIAANLVFIVADAVAVKAILPGEALFDAGTTRELGSALISAVIWIPYLLRSRRAKNTFVDPRSVAPRQ